MPFGLLLVLLCLGLFKAGILFALEFALLRSVLAKLKPPRLTLGLLAKLALIATGFSLPPLTQHVSCSKSAGLGLTMISFARHRRQAASSAVRRQVRPGDPARPCRTRPRMGDRSFAR